MQTADEAKQLEFFTMTTPEYYMEMSIDERFESFHAANPHVYPLLVARARKLKARDVTRVGIALIFEALRYDVLVTTGRFKLNNNYRALYARLIMSQEPDLEGFFNLRERKPK